MKIAVIGSRSLKRISIDQYLENEQPSEIISGGAAGIDTLAEKWAIRRGIPVTIFFPDYKCYGKRAPLIRNEQIVEAAEKIIAIWDGKSTGTIYTVKLAKRMGKQVVVHDLSKTTSELDNQLSFF